MTAVASWLVALALISGLLAVFCAAIAAEQVRREQLNADRARRFRRALERKGRVVEVITRGRP